MQSWPTLEREGGRLARDIGRREEGVGQGNHDGGDDDESISISSNSVSDMIHTQQRRR